MKWKWPIWCRRGGAPLLYPLYWDKSADVQDSYVVLPHVCECLLPDKHDCKQWNYPKGCYYADPSR